MMASACTAETHGEEDVGAAGDAVRGGHSDGRTWNATNEYGAVGLLQLGDGTLRTAVLIAPRIILTSAHVLEQTRRGGAWFRYGPGEHDVVALDSGARHPRSVPYTHQGSNAGNYGRDPRPEQVDLGVAVLKSAPRGVRPMPVQTEPFAAGPRCVAVGFDTLARERRYGDVTITSRTTNDRELAVRFSGGFETDRSAHDLGSPLVCNGTVVGIYSYRTQSSSAAVVAHYERVDAPNDVMGTWAETIAEYGERRR